MKARWIWALALLVYALFSFWYNSWSGPLSAEEIDRYMEYLAGRSEGEVDPEQRAVLRAFLEADDGGEFFMVNLIRLHPGPVPVPGSDEELPAAAVLEKYTGVFLPDLLLRAGHPVFYAAAAGGYLDRWGVEPDPGWSAAGVVRYRSRRDMMELATDPAFDPIHVFKVAAMANTLAFPAAPGIVLFGPRVWIALLLALIAALGHLRAATRRVT